MRAGAGDISVGEEPPVGLAVKLLGCVRQQELFLLQAEEEILGQAMVVRGVRVGKQVEADPERLERFEEPPVVTPKYFLRAHAFFVRSHRDWRAVGVRSGDEKDGLPAQPLEAREDVRGQVGPGNVAQMEVAVSIRPCRADKVFFRHVGDSLAPLTNYSGKLRERAITASLS